MLDFAGAARWSDARRNPSIVEEPHVNTSQHAHIHAAIWCAVLVALGPASVAWSVDCNNNGVEDALDILNATSTDCDLNGVPDECQPDSNGNGIIDACDSCGTQVTDNDTNVLWGLRQSATSQGKVLWFDEQDSVFFYDGEQAQLLQQRIVGVDDLGGIADFVFGLGSGAADGQVVACWRRGTDFAWVWTNDGQDPKLVQATNPYSAALPMNPEGMTIADGCVFIAYQANDPNTAVLIKHIFKVDVATGQATLLTTDFLADTTTGGDGADPINLRTSGCQAAWSWCRTGLGGVCDPNSPRELHLYDGTSVSAIDTDAVPLSFAGGRLIYTKVVDTVEQLFLYDTNLESPTPTQLTAFEPTDKKLLFAQTDGQHVAMLVGDVNGQNREIIMLGGLQLTNSIDQPTDNPPNPLYPLQLQKGQLLWTAQDSSAKYFDGDMTTPVCSEGWLADGFIAQSRRSNTTGPDKEVWVATGKPPKTDRSAPLIQKIITNNNNEVTLSWDTVLGANSYNVYFAQQTGVNNNNFTQLQGGGSVTNINNSPITIKNLEGDKEYFFVVVTVQGDVIGEVSKETIIMPCVDTSLDGDNDGTPDCMDACPEDPNKTVPGLCGCGEPETDGDNDGTPDCVDLCPDDPNKTVPGVCGCGVSEVDADNDGIPDCIDTDVAGDDPGPPPTCGACGMGAVPALSLTLLVLGLVKLNHRRRAARRM